MTLGQLLLGIWLVLVGLAWTTIVVINMKFLGFWALGTGIVWLVEGYHPLPIYTRQNVR